jgi:hypothetical protein
MFEKACQVTNSMFCHGDGASMEVTSVLLLLITLSD